MTKKLVSNGMLPDKSTLNTEELFAMVKQITILDEDREVNLTDIAKLFDKRIDNFKRSKADIIQEISFTQIEGTEIMRIKQAGNSQEQGTFTSSPELVLEFLRYCSPKIAVKMTRVVVELFQKGKVEIQQSGSLTISDRSLASLQRKAEVYDQWLDNGENLNFRTVAKMLNIKGRDLNAFLLEKKIVYKEKKSKRPYFRYSSWFAIKPFVAPSGYHSTQLLVTPKGMTGLGKRLKRLVLPQEKVLLLESV